jgi:hypothetical protein
MKSSTIEEPQRSELEKSEHDELLRLQLRIARRADEIARQEALPPRIGPGRRLWMKAEREVLGPASRIALFNLLNLCAVFSG